MSSATSGSVRIAIPSGAISLRCGSKSSAVKIKVLQRFFAELADLLRTIFHCIHC